MATGASGHKTGITASRAICSERLGKALRLNLAEELGNVSKACQMMGVSRDTFYRYKSARDEGGVEALLEKTRCKPNLKNRIDEDIEAKVLEFSMEYPAHGQVRVSNELRKQAVFVSPTGVRSIWLRHSLQSRKLRLKALEAKSEPCLLVSTDGHLGGPLDDW